MADNAYLKIKIAQLDAEAKRLGKQIAGIKERKKGYEAQLAKQPAKPVTPPTTAE